MMKRAPVPLIALTELFDARSRGLRDTGCRAARRSGSKFRLARFALRCAATAFLTVSLTGCGAVRPNLPTPPVILNLPDCPSPARPALPRIDGALPFDAPGNVAAILERDDVLRLHVTALEQTIACFSRQTDSPLERGLRKQAPLQRGNVEKKYHD